MQSRRVVFLVLLFALAAVSAFAQTCGTPACPTVTTPVATCPEVACPAVQPTCEAVPACPAAGPTCPAAEVVPTTPPYTPAYTGCGQEIPFNPCAQAVNVPSCAVSAGFGGGPLPALQTTACGVDFDTTYLQNIYPLHNNIAALAAQGAQQATDRGLRDLSAKIRDEQMDQNRKVAMWYGGSAACACGPLPEGDCAAGGVVGCLSGLCGAQFDAVYAQTMSDMLMTLRDSALVSAPKLQNPDIRYQANMVARVSQNEITALQRWIADHAGQPGVGY